MKFKCILFCNIFVYFYFQSYNLNNVLHYGEIHTQFLPGVPFIPVVDTDDNGVEFVIIVDDKSFAFDTVLCEKVIHVKLINKHYITYLFIFDKI